MVRIQNSLVEMITGWPAKIAKTNFIRQNMATRRWPVFLMNLFKKLLRSSPLKLVVWIENNLAEMVTRWPSTKTAETNMSRQ